MVALEDWPDAVPLTSERLRLEPLRVEHADELAPVLDDQGLHTYIGGQPSTAEELRERYGRHVLGRSPDGKQRWLNWVVRRGDDGRAVGTVQATVEAAADGLTAEVAWVIGTAHQRQGFAREAASTMVGWLRQEGVGTVVAHVHPEHEGSMGVARAIGLAPTAAVLDGEVRWTGAPGTGSPTDR